MALPSLAAAVGAAGLLAACASGGSGMGSPGPDVVGGTPPTTSLSGLDTMTQPYEVTSSGGVLNLTLRAAFDTLVVPLQYTNGSLVTDTLVLRTYQVINSSGGVDYEGFPGPTLRAFPGDSIHIVLQNRMFPLDSDSTCMVYPAVTSGTDKFQDCFHGADWTNIHYHGMHVTPDSAGDDVLLLIPPGEDYTYGFRIPHNQSPGTHWYHPHKHGSVAIQVMNGMSGALIVDGGPLDVLADQAHMKEYVISLQQIMQSPNLVTGAFTAQTTLANGQLTPVIVMRPGEVQRWRLVDENVTKSNAFRISIQDSVGEEPRLYDVARDGVTYADTNYAPSGVLIQDTSVIVAPGNRLDLFVQAPMNGGLFKVRATPLEHDRANDLTRKDSLRDDQNPLTSRGRRTANESLGATGTAAVFYVQVDTTLAPNGSYLPQSLPPQQVFLQNLPGPLDPDSIDLSTIPIIVFADSDFSTHSVNDPTKFYLGTATNPYQQFDSDSVYVPRLASNVPAPMVLDSVQTWQVVNRSIATNHPFHIHINPFQVIDVYYPNPTDPNITLYQQLDSAAQNRGTPIWLDVLALPLPQFDTTFASNGTTVVSVDTVPGYIIIRQGYEPFRNADGSICTSCGPAYGQFVMHCHILGHEERGMMQVLQIMQSAGQMPGAIRSDANHGMHAGTGRGSGPGSGTGGGGGGRGNGGGGGGGGGHQH
jgi:FtsP/CotA-like multicopper oxidase with cupredoxin domain